MKIVFGKYVLPTVERLDIDVEQGFASSIIGGESDNDGIFGDDSWGSGIFGAGSENDGFFE